MSDVAGGGRTTAEGQLEITCPRCGSPTGGHFEERGGLVHMRVGGLLVERAACAACGKMLYFTASPEPLPEFIARLLERRAKREGQE